MHRVNLNKNVSALTGFKYDDDNNQKGSRKNNSGGTQKDDCVIRDKEGVDFRLQYLSQQESKSQVTCIDEHQDGVFDFRDFYNMKYQDEEVEKEGDLLKVILSLEGYRDIDSGSEKRHSEEHYYKKKTSTK